MAHMACLAIESAYSLADLGIKINLIDLNEIERR